MTMTNVTRATVQRTEHTETGMVSFDVVVCVEASNGRYIESVHWSEADAQQRAARVVGRAVDLLDLVYVGRGPGRG